MNNQSDSSTNDNEKKTRKRRSSTIVKDKKHIQRTVNTFMKKASYITMQDYGDKRYEFEYKDEYPPKMQEFLLYNVETYRMKINDTQLLLEKTTDLTEYRPYIEVLKIVINELQYIKIVDGHDATFNKFLKVYQDVEDDDAMVINKIILTIEDTMNKTISEKLAKMLHTAIKNKILFDNVDTTSFHKVDYLRNELLTQRSFYNKYSWVLDYEDDFYNFRQKLNSVKEQYGEHYPEYIDSKVIEWVEFEDVLIENNVIKDLKIIVSRIGKTLAYFYESDFLYTTNDGFQANIYSPKGRLRRHLMKVYLKNREPNMPDDKANRIITHFKKMLEVFSINSLANILMYD